MPLTRDKFNSYQLNLHFFLSQWGEGSLYSRFFLTKMTCLRYLATRKTENHGRLPEMIFLELVSKMIMQIEDLAHICLFIAAETRHANAFYYSTNEEVRNFFQSDVYLSDKNLCRYMGLDFDLDILAMDSLSKFRLEEIIEESKGKFKGILLAIIKYWHDNHLIAKHYLHGLLNLSLQEARDILPVNLEEVPYEDEVRKRPHDFMTLLMANEITAGRVFNTVEHTSKGVKELLKFTKIIYNITKAITFTELAKLDFAMNGSRYLYLLDLKGKSEEDIELIKKYFVLPWMN